MMDPDKYFGAEDAPISLRLGKEHPMDAGKKSKGLCQHLGRGVTVERLPSGCVLYRLSGSLQGTKPGRADGGGHGSDFAIQPGSGFTG